MLRFAERQGWIGEHWVEIPIVALAAACFAAAQAAGGSGFIACFVGGLLLSGLGEHHKEELLRGAEHMGEALALLTWVVFGGIVVARMIDRVTWPALLYAVLSLTVIRMLPVFLCLIGTRTSTADKLFIGWFGPRGLATIVFAVLVLDEKLPGNDTIILAAGWTVLLSVIAHGVTANPLVRRLAARPSTEAEIVFAPPVEGWRNPRMRSEPLYYEGGSPALRAGRESRRPRPSYRRPAVARGARGVAADDLLLFRLQLHRADEQSSRRPVCDWDRQFHAGHNGRVGGGQGRYWSPIRSRCCAVTTGRR